MKRWEKVFWGTAGFILTGFVVSLLIAPEWTINPPLGLPGDPFLEFIVKSMFLFGTIGFFTMVFETSPHGTSHHHNNLKGS